MVGSGSDGAPLLLPVPWQQLIKPIDGMVRDTGEDIGQPGLRIDVVEPRSLDERVKDGGALTATVGAAEEPSLPAKRHTSQGTFSGVVRDADASIVEEAGERSLPRHV